MGRALVTSSVPGASHRLRRGPGGRSRCMSYAEKPKRRSPSGAHRALEMTGHAIHVDEILRQTHGLCSSRTKSHFDALEEARDVVPDEHRCVVAAVGVAGT